MSENDGQVEFASPDQGRYRPRPHPQQHGDNERCLAKAFHSLQERVDLLESDEELFTRDAASPSDVVRDAGEGIGNSSSAG
jgi:hypothetical protein